MNEIDYDKMDQGDRNIFEKHISGYFKRKWECKVERHLKLGVWITGIFGACGLIAAIAIGIDQHEWGLILGSPVFAIWAAIIGAGIAILIIRVWPD